MYHVPNESEYEITSKLDFVVPLKQVGLITRAVLESIHVFYKPRRIIIISSKNEGNIVRSLSPHWNAGVIEFVDEETFFEPNYNISIQQILAQYDATREGDQREPGWWIQQLIKLGAASQIPNISTNYVVWDGDLVPTRRWKLGSRDRNGVVKYYIAILQAEARSEFNSYQYAMCMKALTGETPRDPQGGGTFVAHHMVFNKYYVQEMLQHMRLTTGSALPWPLLIMSYSRKFYRFSEYKTYATFMLNHHPSDFHYHPLSDFGEGGLRFRDANRIIEQLLAACPLSKGGLSYGQIVTFAKENMKEFQGPINTAQEVRQEVSVVPGYIQLDHVYGIAKLGLDPEDLPVLSPTSHTSHNSTNTNSSGISGAMEIVSRANTPHSSITSSITSIDELISAASAGASAVAADELPLGTEADLYCGASTGNNKASALGVAHQPSANISNMTPSAEFKVTRVRPGRSTTSSTAKNISNNTNMNINNTFSTIAATSPYYTTSTTTTACDATSKVVWMATPPSAVAKVAAAKSSHYPHTRAASCPADAIGYISSISNTSKHCDSSVYISNNSYADGYTSKVAVGAAVYLTECKDESVLKFPVLKYPIHTIGELPPDMQMHSSTQASRRSASVGDEYATQN